MKLVSILVFILGLIFPTNGAGSADTWNDYVTKMTDSGNIKQGAVISLDNGVPWAYGGALSLKDGEGKALVTLLKNPESNVPSGVTLAGVKYLGHKTDDSFFGKSGDDGVICKKTKMAVIIGTYTKGMQLGKASFTLYSGKCCRLSEEHWNVKTFPS